MHRLPFLLVLALLLAGCTATGGMTEAEKRAAVSELLDTATSVDDAAVPELPAAITDLLAPTPVERDGELTVDEPRFDLTADGVNVAAFYQGLVEGTPYNVVVHPDVSGQISLNLKDVSVPEVMDVLREGFGYHYQRTASSYLVLPSGLESRVFQLDYINVEREGLSGTNISAGEITSEDDDSRQGDASGSTLSTRSNSRLWADIEEAITQLLASEADEGAQVVASPDAGAVVVRATPDTLDQVEDFIAGLQKTIDRQVILEARIVEVSLSDEFEAGIDWERVGSTSGEDTTVDLSPGGNDDQDFNLFELGIVRGASFDATIEALDQQGDVMVLSSPRVSTLNNQKALIKVGTDSFFQTDVDLDTTISDGDTRTDVDPEFRSFFSGISLDVTPSISADGWVTLHVQPSVSNVTETTRSIDTGEGDTVSFRLASSDVRQSDSIVRARDGDLIVIGGLMEERERSIDAQVPGIGAIPPLGLLFSREQQSSSKIELVILMRPTVVDDDTFRQTINQQLEDML